MSSCPECKQRISWVATEADARMPVDPDPVDDGNLVIISHKRDLTRRRRDGKPAMVPVVQVLSRVLSAEPMLPGLEFAIDDDRPRFRPHAASCPGVPQHHADRGRLQLIQGGQQ